MKLRRCLCYACLACFQVVVFVWFYLPWKHEENLLKKLEYLEEKNVLHLKDDKLEKFFFYSNTQVCLIDGSDKSISTNGKCVCLSGWTSSSCSVPSFLTRESWVTSENELSFKTVPRRIVLVVLFNGSNDILELNLEEIGPFVNAIIIGDPISFTSAYEDTFISKLRLGWLRDHLDKILYFELEEKPLSIEEGFDLLVNESFRFISDVRSEDLVLFITSDQIINRNLLTFLKFYYHYPLPANCIFDHYLYGFYWKLPQNIKSFPCLVNVIDFLNSYDSRYSNLINRKVNVTNPTTPKIWNMSHTGWHCLNCISPSQIYFEIAKQPPSSHPSWFTISSEKMNEFIAQLIKSGQDFNKVVIGEKTPAKENFPSSLYEKKYLHLLRNPYEKLSNSPTINS